MGDTTSIEWTDATWNPLRGCSRVSPGCKKCYAEGIAHRFSGPGKPFEGLTKLVNGHPTWTGKIRLVDKALTAPLRWREPRMVFVNSMSDLFHESVPISFIAAVFGIMRATPQHTYQVLTKRPQRMRAFFETVTPEDVREYTVSRTQRMIAGGWTWPLPNVWLMTSVEDQERVDERIRELVRCPAAVHGISAEPLLGQIDLRPWLPGLQWVICGGESGHGARPCALEWLWSVVEQCQAASVPCFVKQVGKNPTRNGEAWPLDFDAAKGGNTDDWPRDLRVRQFPEAA